MVIDSGDGLTPTITKTAWKILLRTKRKVQFWDAKIREIRKHEYSN